MSDSTLSKFQRRIAEILRTHSGLKDFHALAAWLLETKFGLNLDTAIEYIVDGTHDRGIDVIWSDDIDRRVLIVQSKFHQHPGKATTSENDVRRFVSIIEDFKSHKAFRASLEGAREEIKRKLEKAYILVHDKGYRLSLFYVTTDKESAAVTRFISSKKVADGDQVQIVSYNEVLRLHNSWEKGYSPPLGEYRIKVAPGEIFQHHEKGGLRAWVATLHAREIKKLAKSLHTPQDLCRKNVREFLGNIKKSNKAIGDALSDKAELFWHFNNGIVILCDSASLDSEAEMLIVNNPQVINGCQTASKIYETDFSGEPSLIARIIECSDEKTISDIIVAANTQSPIDPVDLRANDYAQVTLQRGLEFFGYFYQRKRGERLELQKSGRLKKYRGRYIVNVDVAQDYWAFNGHPNEALRRKMELFEEANYGHVFPGDEPAADYLLPNLSHGLIRDIGTKRKKGEVKKFNNRARFYVLGLLGEVIGKFNATDRRSLIDLLDGRMDECVKLAKRPVLDMFAFCKQIWRKERNRSDMDFEDYFKSKTAEDQILYASNAKKALQKRVARAFQRIVALDLKA